MKKLNPILSFLLPIAIIVGYILFNKFNQNREANNLKELDEQIVLILKDSSSTSHKYIKHLLLNRTIDSTKVIGNEK